MKRIVTILITLVVCFTIAFPVSAAAIDYYPSFMMDYEAACDTSIILESSNQAGEYKYKAYFVYTGDAGQNLVPKLSVLYFKTQNPKHGEFAYHRYYQDGECLGSAIASLNGASYFGVGNISYNWQVSSTRKWDIAIPYYGNVGLTGTPSYIIASYYIESLSTAKLNIRDDYHGYILMPPDVTELEQLLDEADTIEDIGYTVASWTRFDNARYSGHELIARLSYTQSEVDGTATELRVSMNSLEIAQTSAPDPPEPPKPPPSPLGYDLATGDISGYLEPVSRIFYRYVLSAKGVGIGIFCVVISILIIPRVLSVIIPNLRR